MVTDPATGGAIAVTDIHHHLAVGEGTERPDLLASRLELMDRFGIDSAILLPPSGAFGARRPMEALNESTAAVVAMNPSRFPAGVAYIDCHRDRRDQMAELQRCIESLGLRGVVWHHRFDGMFLDHAGMPELFSACADVGVPALVHVVGESTLESLWRLRNLLQSSPQTTVVALDGFSSADRAGHLIQMAKELPRLICDLGAMSSACGYNLERFVAEVGPEQLVLGTDLYVEPPTYHFPFAVHEVLNLPVPFRAKELILNEGARQLFGLAPVDAPPETGERAECP